ncbi:outer membrane lipoprotein LolB [Castellaniella sp.]|uniref:outer membrane lipoprotein LolB n=1 Tax=Castellaniella sp. TaxID=1955812 RepID=UPI00356A64F2
MRLRWLGMLVWLLALVSCAAPSRIGGQAPAFERVGRFAVTLQPADGPAQAVQGGYAWRDDGTRLLLDLSTPLGNVLARLQVEPGQATLQRADGSREQALDADGLVASVWGHPMPVSGLRDWVRGRLVAGQPVQGLRQNAEGRPEAFEQQGWQVRLGPWDAQGPRRIRLLRNDAQGRWQLQLIVDDPAPDDAAAAR